MNKLQIDDPVSRLLKVQELADESKDLPPTSPKRTEEHPLKPKDGNDKRPNFRIVRTCLTCKHGVTSGPSAVRMACAWPYTTITMKKKLGWEGRVTKKFLALLAPTHASCVCKAHKFRGTAMNGIKRIELYCGAAYYGDD